jgi:hypothetical protein
MKIKSSATARTFAVKSMVVLLKIYFGLADKDPTEWMILLIMRPSIEGCKGSGTVVSGQEIRSYRSLDIFHLNHHSAFNLPKMKNEK